VVSCTSVTGGPKAGGKNMRAQSPIIRRLKAQAGVQLVLGLGAAAVFLLCVAIIGAFKVAGDKTSSTVSAVKAGPKPANSGTGPAVTGVTESTVAGGAAAQGANGTTAAAGTAANASSGSG